MLCFCLQGWTEKCQRVISDENHQAFSTRFELFFYYCYSPYPFFYDFCLNFAREWKMLTAECSLSKEVNYVRRIAYKICSSLSFSSTRFFKLTENLLTFAPVYWEWQFRPFLQDSYRLLILACLQPNIPESVDTIIFIISKSCRKFLNWLL